MGVLVFILGLVVGSFLNVLAYRLPRGESVVLPPSHCPACGERLRPWDLVPVISYLTLGGRCRYCRAPISARYPLVELATGALFTLVFVVRGPTPGLAAGLVIVSLMLAVAAVDLEHQRIPNQLTFTGVGIGLVLGLFGLVGQAGAGLPGLWASLLGAIVGGGFLLVIGLVSHGGMGGGDVKLGAAIGALLGWLPGLFGILLGFVIGAVIGLALIVTRVRGRRDAIPFGPFLALGTIISFLWGRVIIQAYTGLWLR
ncbi:MAG TPA: prepilin peptidase [Bacillota bacterium]